MLRLEASEDTPLLRLQSMCVHDGPPLSLDRQLCRFGQQTLLLVVLPIPTGGIVLYDDLDASHLSSPRLLRE
jgi:hypothetical protein